MENFDAVIRWAFVTQKEVRVGQSWATMLKAPRCRRGYGVETSIICIPQILMPCWATGAEARRGEMLERLEREASLVRLQEWHRLPPWNHSSFFFF